MAALLPLMADKADADLSDRAFELFSALTGDGSGSGLAAAFKDAPPPEAHLRVAAAACCARLAGGGGQAKRAAAALRVAAAIVSRSKPPVAFSIVDDPTLMASVLAAARVDRGATARSIARDKDEAAAALLGALWDATYDRRARGAPSPSRQPILRGLLMLLQSRSFLATSKVSGVLLAEDAIDTAACPGAVAALVAAARRRDGDSCVVGAACRLLAAAAARGHAEEVVKLGGLDALRELVRDGARPPTRAATAATALGRAPKAPGLDMAVQAASILLSPGWLPALAGRGDVAAEAAGQLPPVMAPALALLARVVGGPGGCAQARAVRWPGDAKGLAGSAYAALAALAAQPASAAADEAPRSRNQGATAEAPLRRAAAPAAGGAPAQAARGDNALELPETAESLEAVMAAKLERYYSSDDPVLVSWALDSLEFFVNGRPQLPPQMLATLAAQEPQLLPALARRAVMRDAQAPAPAPSAAAAAAEVLGGGGVSSLADLDPHKFATLVSSVLSGISGAGPTGKKLPPPSRACLLLAALARGRRTKADAAGPGGDGAGGAAGGAELRESAAKALRWRIKAGGGGESDAAARAAAAAALRILTEDGGSDNSDQAAAAPALAAESGQPPAAAGRGCAPAAGEAGAEPRAGQAAAAPSSGGDDAGAFGCDKAARAGAGTLLFHSFKLVNVSASVS
ncbi:hypothetical protein MNEG_1108 [Monoraphidium neglectum]|uniref:Uncharacterized protein n=1 Tax=Monoraphidium neglectum TaxID=145388 RepID=A0A0D2LKC2_9CHLO|nr:hypothetical protein MNEG_1108 [Monoraphidium neglectum]KIZ06839.1 hypothetical protein MNEG_1108 [Monoraphidium neglectum]|eukprot:XP_013905858.1 hypothetical protein MNEG_1108 [Monoraphidium neglectum]